MNEIKILQICHGLLIPQYNSAYSLRCYNIIGKNRWKMVTTGGIIFKDILKENIEEYHSIISTAYAFLIGNRSLEIIIAKGKFIRRKYYKTVVKYIKEADVVMFEGPWQYNLFKNYLENKFVIYDAHNVESSLRLNNKYHEITVEIENELSRRANMIISVTEENAEYFKKVSGSENIYINTHVVNSKILKWNGKNSNNVVFIGSIYKPNIDAVERIIDIAKDFPDLIFNIIGNVNKFNFKNTGNNIKFLGILDDSKKDEIFSNSFLALNPVEVGSGRNVKMVDYLMHELPVISTQTGIRGFEKYDISKGIIVSNIEKFSDEIRRLNNNRELVRQYSEGSLKLYRELMSNEGESDMYNIILQKYKDYIVKNYN